MRVVLIFLFNLWQKLSVQSLRLVSPCVCESKGGPELGMLLSLLVHLADFCVITDFNLNSKMKHVGNLVCHLQKRKKQHAHEPAHIAAHTKTETKTFQNTVQIVCSISPMCTMESDIKQSWEYESISGAWHIRVTGGGLHCLSGAAC